MNRIVTKTLAEIYFKQGHLQKAYEIYIALSEKDPLDPEIQKRLKELQEKLSPSMTVSQKPPYSKVERIRFLEKWLTNIQKRKKSNGKFIF